MVLKINKKEEGVDEVELVHDGFNVELKINSELIALICDDGSFEFYGQSNDTKFEGFWNK